jgi:hypothetical protein
MPSATAGCLNPLNHDIHLNKNQDFNFRLVTHNVSNIYIISDTTRKYRVLENEHHHQNRLEVFVFHTVPITRATQLMAFKGSVAVY